MGVLWDQAEHSLWPRELFCACIALVVLKHDHNQPHSRSWKLARHIHPGFHLEPELGKLWRVGLEKEDSGEGWVQSWE